MVYQEAYLDYVIRAICIITNIKNVEQVYLYVTLSHLKNQTIIMKLYTCYQGQRQGEGFTHLLYALNTWVGNSERELEIHEFTFYSSFPCIGKCNETTYFKKIINE